MDFDLYLKILNSVEMYNADVTFFIFWISLIFNGLKYVSGDDDEDTTASPTVSISPSSFSHESMLRNVKHLEWDYSEPRSSRTRISRILAYLG